MFILEYYKVEIASAIAPRAPNHSPGRSLLYHAIPVRLPLVLSNENNVTKSIVGRFARISPGLARFYSTVSRELRLLPEVKPDTRLESASAQSSYAPLLVLRHQVSRNLPRASLNFHVSVSNRVCDHCESNKTITESPALETLEHAEA